MIWKSLSVLSASSSPIVVVLSGSMEPAFQRGDLLFLWNRAPRAEIGEIVVYNVVSCICLNCDPFRANAHLFPLLAERKRHSHCAPRNTNIPGGRRKEQQGQGDHSVCLPFKGRSCLVKCHRLDTDYEE